MFYVVCLEKVSDGYVVSVPDVPGCFSAGDTFAEALHNVKEAIAFHIEGMLEDGEEIPQPQDLEVHLNNPEYQGLLFSGVEVDLTYLMGKSEKINVTLPSLLIRRIDELVARNPEYKTRSGFLAQIATERIFTQS
ncbi:type II toxin-antitoxin system HicB family antitoxin [Actinobacillus genomosp. 2]|uniref:type II toxin-antitoxin system HicB family antitoxin n=1 Tax=Actinobacillus genomosp. 2 TaxID=230709 RepID=UPI002441768E|nr:type II toxin-antitoxin system HicB family antitoxin [Actinobacillus genomosp. 2]WGE32541.1 type II toxin-antitoxin system HicB family antitoxin [Actinobacillus genomosp. 2]